MTMGLNRPRAAVQKWERECLSCPSGSLCSTAGVLPLCASVSSVVVRLLLLVLTSLLIAKTCRTQGTKKRTSQACTNTSPGPMLHGNTPWYRHPHAAYSLLKVYSGHTVQRLKRQNLGLPPQTKYSSNSTHTETRCTAFQKNAP